LLFDRYFDVDVSNRESSIVTNVITIINVPMNTATLYFRFTLMENYIAYRIQKTNPTFDVLFDNLLNWPTELMQDWKSFETTVK